MLTDKISFMSFLHTLDNEKFQILNTQEVELLWDIYQGMALNIGSPNYVVGYNLMKYGHMSLLLRYIGYLGVFHFKRNVVMYAPTEPDCTLFLDTVSDFINKTIGLDESVYRSVNYISLTFHSKSYSQCARVIAEHNNSKQPVAQSNLLLLYDFDDLSTTHINDLQKSMFRGMRPMAVGVSCLVSVNGNGKLKEAKENQEIWKTKYDYREI